METLRKSSFKLMAIFSLTILVLFASGCRTEGFKPNITGAMGELLVVMDDTWRNGPEGEALQSVLTQPMLGLPQEEVLFDVSVAPHRAFTGSLRTFRNILIVNIGEGVEQEGIRFFTEGSWARDQAMIHVNARDPQKFLQLLSTEEDRIISFFLRAERDRSLNFFKPIASSDLSGKVQEKWGVQMVIPNTFRANRDSDTFSWMSHETPSLSQGLFIYAFDYSGEGLVTVEYLISKRDSVLKANVPGPSPGSFMTTEQRLPVTYSAYRLNGHEALELRGLWKVEGDFMGGPFVLIAHHDRASQRVLVTDSYVFLPGEPAKRNMVWQMEALLHSVALPVKK